MNYDYIVVGGGSAGCVVANRLVAAHGASVLLLEAGGNNKGMLLDMPAGAFKILFSGESDYISRYQSVPQPSLDGRSVGLAQARVLGGGSSVNALAYMRGSRDVYDAWDEMLGGVGWNWDDLLPYFVRQEGNQALVGASHGNDGPFKVSRPAMPCRSSDAFIDTMEALGVPRVHDFNSGDLRGAGYIQTTSYNAKRCSAANAFIDPIRRNSKLTIITEAVATRIVFDGDRAVGVEYMQKGERKTARCGEEVVLTAGALVSPKLLMLSGIGPAEDLRRHGIAAHVDLPGVGQSMQDHNLIALAAYTDGAYGYFGADRGMRLLSNFLRYKMFGTGPIASNGSESVAFVDVEESGADPNLQIYLIPVMWLAPGQGKPGHGITLMANLIRPKSRGWVRLRSADPLASVEFSPNYLAAPEDLATLIRGFRYLRRILSTEPLRGMVKNEVVPGERVSSDEDIAAYCKATTETNYHPVGSCRMGKDDDPMAVVDAELRVRGVQALRVLDASVMPLIPTANTNAPTMAVADRGVDLMTGRASLRPYRQAGETGASAKRRAAGSTERLQ